MRVWGRITIPAFIIGVTPIGGGAIGGPALKWVAVETDANGSNDLVYVTALIQCLLLNLKESPFWSNYGIPAQQSVMTQVFPDYYVALTQIFFASFFASLILSKQPGRIPTYSIKVMLHNGVKLDFSIPIPE